MKKFFTILSLAIVTTAFAQLPTFTVYKTNNAGVSTATLLNGSSLLETTAPTSTASSGLLQTKLKIVNFSTTTNTYNVIRSFVFENPIFDLTQTTNPYTYFCFGNTCFPASVSVPTSFDYTILGPAGTNTATCCNGTNTTCCSATFDNSSENGTPFIVYLQEAAAMGKYHVKYKVYNVNNANDTVTFTIKYNDGLSVPNLLGVNNIANVLESVSEVYPNPTNTNASLAISLKQENDVKVQVYNSLGALVYTSPNQKYAQGKHKLTVDCNNYNSGLYIVTVTAGDSKITKRLVINK